MRGMVRRAVSDREVAREPEEVAGWINKEAIPLLREMRDVHGLEPVVGAAVSSAGDGVFTNIWTSDPVPTDSVVQVEARIIGRATSGAPQAVSYVRRATFVNEAGVLAQLGTTVAEYSDESDSGFDVRLQISGSGTALTLDVQDDGVSPTYWTAKLSMFRTPAA